MSDFSTGLQNANEIEITVTGRTSGRSLTYPIWFALDGDKLYLIPLRGSDTEWYKNLRKTATIRLTARGKTFTTNVRLITDEAQLDASFYTLGRGSEALMKRVGSRKNKEPSLAISGLCSFPSLMGLRLSVPLT